MHPNRAHPPRSGLAEAPEPRRRAACGVRRRRRAGGRPACRHAATRSPGASRPPQTTLAAGNNPDQRPVGRGSRAALSVRARHSPRVRVGYRAMTVGPRGVGGRRDLGAVGKRDHKLPSAGWSTARPRRGRREVNLDGRFHNSRRARPPAGATRSHLVRRSRIARGRTTRASRTRSSGTDRSTSSLRSSTYCLSAERRRKETWHRGA